MRWPSRFSPPRRIKHASLWIDCALITLQCVMSPKAFNICLLLFQFFGKGLVFLHNTLPVEHGCTNDQHNSYCRKNTHRFQLTQLLIPNGLLFGRQWVCTDNRCFLLLYFFGSCRRSWRISARKIGSSRDCLSTSLTGRWRLSLLLLLCCLYFSLFSNFLCDGRIWRWLICLTVCEFWSQNEAQDYN